MPNHQEKHHSRANTGHHYAHKVSEDETLCVLLHGNSENIAFWITEMIQAVAVLNLFMEFNVCAPTRRKPTVPPSRSSAYFS